MKIKKLMNNAQFLLDQSFTFVFVLLTSIIYDEENEDGCFLYIFFNRHKSVSLVPLF